MRVAAASDERLAVPLDGRRGEDRTASPAGLRAFATVATLVALVAYFVGLHAMLVVGDRPTLVLAMVLAPWLAIVAPVVARGLRAPQTGRRVLTTVIAAALLVAIVWALVRFGSSLGRRADNLLYLENLAFFGWLSGLFAFSLAGDGDALVTRLARKTRRGDMPPAVVRYTRGVTIAWAAFFLAAMAVSTWLFVTRSREAWSLYINVLQWPIVGIGFVVEYLVRIRLLKDVRHVPFSAAIHAFRERSDDA